ncbi:MAG: hypothetical protein U0264_09125 [Candidatus Kapaibacterium sp.]
MKQLLHLTAILIVSFTVQISLHAQQPLYRDAIPMFNAQPYDSTDVLFPIAKFYGQLQRGIGSYNNEMFWNIKLGGLFQFYRFENSSINFLSLHELNATPYNDITFDPSAARWEETLNYSYQLHRAQYTVGYTHRCKHDIDNFDPVDTSSGIDVSQLQKRVVILSGPYLEFQNVVPVTSSSELHVLARVDYTPISSDYRYPRTSNALNWDDIDGEISLATRYTYTLSNTVGLHTKLWLNTAFFRSIGARSNYRVEVAATLHGKSNGAAFFIAHEYMVDDLSGAIPHASEVVYVGFRLVSVNFW